MIIPIRFVGFPEKEDEIFKFITYPEVQPKMYKISNYGDVVNNNTGRTLKYHLDKDGYKRIGLVTPRHKKKYKNYSIHKLVAHEYIPNPDPINKRLVNHKDGIKRNSYYRNLEHCTDSENRQHAKISGLMAYGEKNPLNRYPESLAREICSYFEQGKTQQDVNNIYDCASRRNRSMYDLIRHLYNRTTWSYVTRDYNY